MVSSGAFELGRDGAEWVVVGLDGSVNSYRAGAYAAGLARRQGSRLAVVVAHDFRVEIAVGSETALEAAQEAGARFVDELRATLKDGSWPSDAALFAQIGPPAQVLAEVADQLAAGLIVLGAPRRHPALRAGGRVVADLMRLRRWPVLVVP